MIYLQYTKQRGVTMGGFGETKPPEQGLLRGDRSTGLEADESSRKIVRKTSETLRKGSNAQTPSRESKHRGLWQLVEYPGNMSPGDFADMPVDVRELYSPAHVAVALVVEKPTEI